MATIKKTEETQETTTTEPVPFPNVHCLCPAHKAHFPEEDALRPVKDWSHNPATLEPLRTYCKRCDAANKSRYTSKKKATSGSLAVERMRELIDKERESLANPTAWTRDDDPAVVRARDYIAYLEEQRHGSLRSTSASCSSR